MLSQIINSVGLIGDMSGAALLIKFGLAPNLDISQRGPAMTWVSGAEEQKVEAQKIYRRYKFWESVGFSSIFGGSALQLIATWIA